MGGAEWSLSSVVEVAVGAEDTFSEGTWQSETTAEAQGGADENLMVSPHPQLSQTSYCIPGGTCPSLLLASCMSPRLMLVLGWKGLFPSKGMVLLNRPLQENH